MLSNHRSEFPFFSFKDSRKSRTHSVRCKLKVAKGGDGDNNRTKEKKQRMRTEKKARMKSSVGATHEVHRSGLLVRRVGGD